MTFQDQVLVTIYAMTGAKQVCTGALVMSILKPQDSPLYGYQRRVSSAIASLRQLGYLDDVTRRCRVCHGALTRRHRNVPLIVTDKGIAHLWELPTRDLRQLAGA